MFWIFFSTLVPLLDLVSLMQFKSNASCFSVLASVECWTCKWYFALTLFACISSCSFTVWMFIVVTIYSDCSCIVKLCIIVIFILAWSYCACFICFLSFPLTMNLMSAFCDIVFRRPVHMVQEIHRSRIRCSEFWQLFPTHIFKSRVSFRVLSRNSQREKL